jgi:SAM-dependent methyltransferase
MRELPFHQEFDAVVNLFTSFGYFSDEADDLAALERVRAAIEPGGHFLIETLHREGLEPRFQPHVEYTTSDGAQVERDYNWDLAHDVLEDRVRLTRADGSTAEYETAFRLRPREAWVDLLERAGFGSIIMTGGLDGNALTPTSRRLAIVCAPMPA